MMKAVKTKVTEFLEVMNVQIGDDVFLRLVEDEIHLYTREQAIKRIQERIRRHIPDDVSLVDELIADRRREAENE